MTSKPVFGINEEFEIETFEEFNKLIKGKDLSQISLKGYSNKTTYNRWIFQEVDFSLYPLQEWKRIPLEGGLFLGCTFPTGSYRILTRILLEVKLLPM